MSDSFSIGSALQLELELDPPRFGLTADDLFQTALRQNKQRAFLFVSKVLGKHLPIRPAVLPAAGKLLSLALEGEKRPGQWVEVLRGEDTAPFPALMEELEAERICLGPSQRTLFVGFAETATGLARAVAACYGGECAYISTTRYPLAGWEPLTFEESHSHAKTHLLHLPPEDGGWRRAVIVDDEFTTGSTALRLVEALHRQYGIPSFTLLSLLDWTDGENRGALAERLGVEIQMVSLLHGAIRSAETASVSPALLDDWRERVCFPASQEIVTDDRYLKAGRLLLSAAGQAESRQSCLETAQRLGPAGPDTLFLGTGELIYEPALIAGYCGAAAFHSTTQSPVYPLPGSAIVSGVRFDPPDCYSSAGYLYNVPHGRYRRTVIFSERETERPQGLDQLADWLRHRGCRQVEVVLL